jgi:TRAP-type mannitol/chloroaromatic compound transport system permease small subunit
MNRWIAQIAVAFVLAGCLISAGNAASRYVFSISSNAWLEVQWQIFAGIFLLGAPYVLKLNEHVRVDLLYGAYSHRGKLLIDIFGIIFFLLPVAFIVVEMSLPWAIRSFREGEISANAGGLPIWPVKFLLPLGFALLFLQGLSELVKRIAGLTGDLVVETSYEKPLQ